MTNKSRWKLLAKGRKPVGVMNKTEGRFADILERRRLAGDVLWWKYEALTLKLADHTRYTPDFVVMLADGLLECIDVKGFTTENSRTKIKLAAELFPLRMVIVRETKMGWEREEIGGC